MVIQKVINNNVISAYDENQQEVVIMGKGIGFKAHTGDAIDESRVEKVFRIENEKLSRQFQEILENIPLEHMQLTSDIITYAKKNLNVQLNQSIYITLTDHINFAIQRQVQGIQLKNALLWEIKKFYHQEYLMGKYAINLLNEKLGTKFSGGIYRTPFCECRVRYNDQRYLCNDEYDTGDLRTGQTGDGH